jgi:DNA-3-methyladenine glycosylase
VKPLSLRFYDRPTEQVARALLGKRIVCGRRTGCIVETEAYLGPQDAASHARFGRTARNEVMFERGGIAYVYFIYGMYDMFNVVTHRGREAGAVLIRAVAPVEGMGSDSAVASGPGKLTRALGITRRHHGVDLTTAGRLFITGGRRTGEIATGPRVGVQYAGEWAKRPLRFWIEGHPAVSKKR